MKKDLRLLITLHFLIVFTFTAYYLIRGGYEFMIYIAVILFFTWLVWVSRETFKYSMGLLWALAIWSWLHLAGGGIPVGEGVLYQWMIWPLSESYSILRFDQFVHAYGFGVVVFVVYALLRPFTKTKASESIALSIVIVAGAMGFGALNEVVEFLTTVVTPKTGVGGYINNALDLVFNLVGALIALFIIRYSERLGKKATDQ